MRYNRNNLLLEKIDQQLSDLDKEEPKIQKPNCFLSDEQLNEHFDIHYKNYVDNYKKSAKLLESTSTSDKVEYRNILLDISFNYNGVILHENYFESLGKNSIAKSALDMIDKCFGSFDQLKIAMVDALLVSRGWVILGHNKIENNLCLTLVDGHDINCMLVDLVLALDVWEHAMYIDYKSDKESYAKDLVEDINWDIVSKKMDKLF